MKRTRLLVPALAVVVGAGCGSGAGDDPPVVAARVEGATITADRVAQLSQQYAEAAPAEGETLDEDAARRVVLGFLIRLTYLDTLAQERAIKVGTNVALERVLSATTPEDFAGSGWTPEDVRNGTLAGELSMRLAAEIFPDVAVSEDEVARRYEDQRILFEAGWSAAVHVAYVATREAAEALQGVADADAFDARAEEVGAAQAGSMGTVTSATSLPPEILGAIGGTAPGTTSPPLQAAGGWLAFYVDSREEVPARTAEEATAELRGALQEEKRQQLFDAWFHDRLRGASVIVDSDFGTWDAASGAVR